MEDGLRGDVVDTIPCTLALRCRYPRWMFVGCVAVWREKSGGGAWYGRTDFVMEGEQECLEFLLGWCCGGCLSGWRGAATGAVVSTQVMVVAACPFGLLASRTYFKKD